MMVIQVMTTTIMITVIRIKVTRKAGAIGSKIMPTNLYSVLCDLDLIDLLTPKVYSF